MPTENSPLAETSETNPQPEAPKSNIRSFIVGSLIVALLATWGYIIWDKSNTKQIIEQKDNKNTSLTFERDSIQKMFDTVSTKYSQLKITDAGKDSTIFARDKEIAEKRKYIQSILSKNNATKEELAQAKAMIASLNENVDGLKKSVDSLTTANTQLAMEKQQVTQQRDVALKNLDSTNQVVKAKENVIDIGSTLHASNFNIIGVDEKKNGKEKETSNAKKVNKLKISFDIDENLITPTGTQTLYVCITGPDGKPISIDELGSGVFTTREGDQKTFTQKLDINYIQAKRQTVSFNWKQNTNFSIGDYKIEVYNNGFKIGDGVVHLKKGGLFG